MFSSIVVPESARTVLTLELEVAQKSQGKYFCINVRVLVDSPAVGTGDFCVGLLALDGPILDTFFMVQLAAAPTLTDLLDNAVAD